MTLYGDGVITKPYFAIFEAFKESMTLNLVHRSFKVILLFWLKFGGVLFGVDLSCWGLQRVNRLG